MIVINRRRQKIVCMAVRVINWYEETEGMQHHPDRSFFRGDRTLPSSCLLFTCFAVGERGMYPGSTVVKELFKNTLPPEVMSGDTVPTLVGVDGWSEVKCSSPGDEGKS